MTEKVLSYLMVFLGGMAVWGIKSFIVERTKKRRADDQVVTLGELKEHCKREQDEKRKRETSEIMHLKEMIGKDLEHDSKRFEGIEKQMSKQSKMLICINKTLALLKQAVENKFSIKIKAPELNEKIGD